MSINCRIEDKKNNCRGGCGSCSLLVLFAEYKSKDCTPGHACRIYRYSTQQCCMISQWFLYKLSGNYRLVYCVLNQKHKR